jgi:hypothetical protein
LLRLLVIRDEHFRGQLFFLPKGSDDLERILIFEAAKAEVLLNVGLMVPAGDGDGLKRGLGESGDGVDDDGCFLDDSEHVGNEHEVLLSDVESAEVGEVVPQRALIVLEDGLVGQPQVLADDLGSRLFLRLAQLGAHHD